MRFIKKIIVQPYPTDIIHLTRFRLHLSEIPDSYCIARYLHKEKKPGLVAAGWNEISFRDKTWILVKLINTYTTYACVLIDDI